MKNTQVNRFISFASVQVLFWMFAISCTVKPTQYYPLNSPVSENGTKTVIENSVAPTSISKTIMPSIDPTVMRTAIPEKSAASTSTATKTEPLMENRYFVVNDHNQAIYLVDSLTGKSRVLESDEASPDRFVAFVGDGCGLIVRLEDKSIVHIDLKAQIIKELLPADWYQGSGTTSRVTFSPTGEWIAYYVGYGSQGYASWEFEDVETMRLADRLVFRLSEHGGARNGGVWSPDGSWIAFSDYDENQINQIYLANADVTIKVQLTAFKEKNNRILNLLWSPDGNKIAFQLYSGIDKSISLGVVFTSDMNVKVETNFELPGNVRNLWWNDNNTLIIHASAEDETPDHGEGIIWLSIDSGQVIRSLWESDLPDKRITAAGYFDLSVVYLLSDFRMFTYDLQTGTVQPHFEFYWGYSELALAPLEFPGEDNCAFP